MMMELILGLVGSFVLTEIHVCLPAFARWVVRRHVATLPSDLRERMAEEWLAEVEACPSHVQKVIFALGLLTGTGDLVRAHGEQQARASTRDKTDVTGDVTVTLTGVSATGQAGNLTAFGSGDHGLRVEAPNAVIRVSDTITASIREAVGTAAGSSAANGVPLTWQNSSVFDAANVAIRNSYNRRAAHTAAIASSMISSSAVLFPPSVDT